MERTIEHRLPWMLEATGVFHSAMAGFPQQERTIGIISDLAFSLYEADVTHHPAYTVFLDIQCAFDDLPHDTIILHLRQNGLCRRLL